ncbi:MAG: hypothetical protein KA085_04300 [Phenylobacterium sp.]|uniref:hypothetical protein n=1 Tax=Phenylobacterium sp. TaxID=1871053 RepID=UPI001B7A6BEF|nr:hypothetical protein [Phenylobacterium sp.]MBP7650769.1 hypothetical protein [Phenylobacterium sp.]MBP7815321.1 hypothetical protein [Phenylobacterium sp.]MBP9754335.1 hypothetical protein [Phenylobacterium sp.]
MLKSITARIPAERAAMALVIVASALVGRQAAIGMDTAQGLSGLAAILGSSMLVIMVKSWPKPEPVKVRARRDD